uniref:Uncharacterized protein n=1 Tax=Rhizophora mucronata TaxID=61149 RepID=A0A2P2M234_RHIMU
MNVDGIWPENVVRIPFIGIANAYDTQLEKFIHFSLWHHEQHPSSLVSLLLVVMATS